MNNVILKKTTSPAVFDPGFSAGRWANAEVGIRDEVPWRSQFPSPNPKKEETSAQGSREESRGSVIQLFSGTMPVTCRSSAGYGKEIVRKPEALFRQRLSGRQSFEEEGGSVMPGPVHSRTPSEA